MCVCKDRYNQAGCRQNNHKDLIIAHKHPLLSKLRIWGTTAALLAAWINILYCQRYLRVPNGHAFLIPFRIIVHNVDVMLNVFRSGFDIGAGMSCEQFVIGCMFGKYFIFLKSFFVSKKSVLGFD